MIFIELSTIVNGVELRQKFNKPNLVVGRTSNSDFCIPDPRISSLHGQIVFKDGDGYYQDMQSTNGSMLESEGERYILDGIKFKEHILSDGDKLLLGDVQKPVVIEVKIWEEDDVQADLDRPISQIEKTIMASRAISDFSMLSNNLLDDKSLVRTLFRFQKEVHDEENILKIYEKAKLFIFNHLANIEYIAIHAEDPSEAQSWRQVYFSSKINDIRQKLKDQQGILQAAMSHGEAILLDAEQLEGLRCPSHSPIKLQSLLLAPLTYKNAIIGFVEAGNTENCPELSEEDLDLVSIVTYILSAKTLNIKLLDAIKKAERRLLGGSPELRSLLHSKNGAFKMIGESPEIQKVRKQISKVAPSDLTVLIQGETGTGKEIVAGEIHRQSKRCNRNFAAVNCTSFSEALLESELFGHVKGSFTGAIENKKGFFEVADGGTLFLDEIGEAPYSLQVKLLRALQEGEIVPVGATETIKVDVRLVCATNRDLEKMVKEGKFREDLFYRVNTFPIYVSPLKDRRSDIIPLANHFLQHFQHDMKKTGTYFSESCKKELLKYHFPGNIRQLKNEVQRALLMAEEGQAIEIEHFSKQIDKDHATDNQEKIQIAGRSLKELMEMHEIILIRQALKENGWNKSKTAQELGISRQAFMVKLSRYGITQNSD